MAFKFRVMPFGKQHVGLKTLTFCQCTSGSKPLERITAKPGNNRTVLPLHPNHLFLQTIPTTIYLTRRVPIYLRKFPICFEIPYSLCFFSFPLDSAGFIAARGSWLQCAGFSGDRIHISCIGRWTFNHWATREGLTACIPSLISFFIPTLSASLPQTFIWRPSSARCWKMSGGAKINRIFYALREFTTSNGKNRMQR